MNHDEIKTLFLQLKRMKEVKDGSFPRTAKLLSAGRNKLAKKVGEEAVEVAVASVANDRKETILESADLLYNLVALWSDMEITPEEIFSEMKRRRVSLGVAEKLPKAEKPPKAVKEVKVLKEKKKG